MAINCGSVPESLLESELFGHVEGAFSGAERDRRGLIARASGGTLFLDEVGDMPPRMQVDLLRVLQEGTVCKVGGDEDEKVDVRFIAASHQRLDQLVAEGKFREDLFYRLNVVEIALPPLRERREDIPLLCQHFLQAFAERDELPEKRLTREATRAAAPRIRCPATSASSSTCCCRPGCWSRARRSTPPTWRSTASGARARRRAGRAHGAPRDGRREPRRLPRVRAPQDPGARSRQHNWNRARAAKALGMPRRTFYRRLQEHRIL